MAAPNKLKNPHTACVLPVRIVFSTGQVFSGVKMGSICCNTHRQTDTRGHKVANMTGDESGWQVYTLYHVFYSEAFLMCGISHNWLWNSCFSWTPSVPPHCPAGLSPCLWQGLPSPGGSCSSALPSLLLLPLLFSPILIR